MSNCTSCGTYAAEGNMICPNCHTKANKAGGFALVATSLDDVKNIMEIELCKTH